MTSNILYLSSFPTKKWFFFFTNYFSHVNTLRIQIQLIIERSEKIISFYTNIKLNVIIKDRFCKLSTSKVYQPFLLNSSILITTVQLINTMNKFKKFFLKNSLVICMNYLWEFIKYSKKLWHDIKQIRYEWRQFECTKDWFIL